MKMKSRVTVAALVVVALLLGSGSLLFAHGWDLESAEKVEGVSGKITFNRPGGFTLTTSGGQKYKLAMQPYRFLEETGMALSSEDRVTVSGYQIEDTVILVTEVKKGSQTYTMLDADDLKRMESDRWDRDDFRRGGPRGPGYGGMMGGPGWMHDRYGEGCWR
jgi:hypothetical protein